MGGRAGLWSRTLSAFRAAVAADRPTPGCGAVAAVAADLGLALVVKGLRISEGHGELAARQRTLARAEALLGRLGAYADDDVRAFGRSLHAARDARELPAEAREEAVREPDRAACAVPLATAHGCLEALGLAVAARPLCSAVVRSDVLAGGLLIHAGLSAALANVDADAPGLQDPEARRRRRARPARLRALRT